MSDDEGRRFFRSGPKRPPPEHGIKIKSAGQTWWGQRWIEALERMAPEYKLRLARGKTYARAGRTHDLTVQAGIVTAKVTGSRAQPYDVELKVAQLNAAAWKTAIETMAKKAQFAAELLAGEMPQAIDEAFESAEVSLFPVRASDLETECSCPDWANPCKHVAATHYVLGEALDRDPFLLFELRGRSKSQVLRELRAARSGVEAQQDQPEEQPIPAIRLENLSTEDYDAPRAPLPTLHMEFEAPKAQAAILKQLGKPPGWMGDDAPAEVLAPLVRAAAERARSIALSDREAPSPEATPAAGVGNEADAEPRSRARVEPEAATERSKSAKAKPTAKVKQRSEQQASSNRHAPADEKSTERKQPAKRKQPKPRSGTKSPKR